MKGTWEAHKSKMYKVIEKKGEMGKRWLQVGFMDPFNASFQNTEEVEP